MEFIIEILQKQTTKRLFAIALLGLFIYLIRPMLNLFLLTFVITYLMYSLQSYIYRLVEKLMPVKKGIITAVLYLSLLALILLSAYKYVPAISAQVMDVVSETSNFVSTLDTSQISDNQLLNYIFAQLNTADIGSYVVGKTGDLIKIVSDIGKWGLNLFMSLILSLFFLIEKDRIQRFLHGFKNSKVSWIYEELSYLGNRFLNSFGKVIQTQILIALVNTLLSVIALWIMGFHQLLGLGTMIFVLSLIPVAGVLISLVPLSMMAYKIGGFMEILYVIIMIAVLHAIESYILNPKLMSVKTDLPVFFTFLVLLISEHFMGIWGLIIGIPIFIFLLDILEIREEEAQSG